MEKKVSSLQLKPALVEMTSRSNNQSSSKGNTISNNLENNSQNDPERQDKVVITNLFISDHVEGQVSIPPIFDLQECSIYFSIDNWKTFQETIAIEIQDGYNDFESNSSEGFLHRYKFDFIIPQQNSRCLDIEDMFDEYGRAYKLQFHAVVKSD